MPKSRSRPDRPKKRKFVQGSGRSKSTGTEVIRNVSNCMTANYRGKIHHAATEVEVARVSMQHAAQELGSSPEDTIEAAVL